MSEIKYAGGTVFETAVILDTESLSSIVVMGRNRLLALIIDGSWSPAAMTFQGSHNGTDFFDLYDKLGNEINYTVATNRFVVVDPVDFAGVCFLKIRSGTSASVAAQDGDINLRLIGQQL